MPGTSRLINRGFVPTELKEVARRAAGQVGGEATVTGMLRQTFRPAAGIGRLVGLDQVGGDARRARRGEPLGGGDVLINRGFVPTELKEVARRAAGQVGGEATVTGMLRGLGVWSASIR
jgi:cytochrome oxidase assembly protein ShyY1